MYSQRIRQAPWTCRHGRSGVTIEHTGPLTSRVDDVFWACRRPAQLPTPRVILRRDCESCAFWEPSPRLEREC
jgi:hypothetical protein